MADSPLAAANIGVVGLAVMGSNLARNLASREGNTVAVYNRSPERTAHARRRAPRGRLRRVETIEEFVASLAKPRTAIIMVQAGKGTDAVIDELAERVRAGRHHRRRRQRQLPPTPSAARRQLRETGIHFVGAGISGGEEGALNGPSIMPGGSDEAYETLGPILASIAAVAEGEPCVTHVGTDGAGHFVKMIHNGIEYADMQLIAEAYDLHPPRHRQDARPRSPTSSPSGTRASSSPTSSRSPPRCCARSTPRPASRSSTSSSTRPARRAPASGPCRTRSTSASRLGHRRGRLRPRALVEARPARGRRRPARPATRDVGRRRRRRLRRGRAPGALRVEDHRLLAGLRRDRRRRRAVRLGHQEGRRSRRSGAAAASSAPGSSTASPRPTPTNPGLVALVTAPYFADAVAARAGGLAPRRRRSPRSRASRRPAFSSSLAYYDGLRADRLPAALVQGQRDFFGAHTYKRVDKRRAPSTRCGRATAARSRPRRPRTERGRASVAAARRS